MFKHNNSVNIPDAATVYNARYNPINIPDPVTDFLRALHSVNIPDPVTASSKLYNPVNIPDLLQPGKTEDARNKMCTSFVSRFPSQCYCIVHQRILLD